MLSRAYHKHLCTAVAHTLVKMDGDVQDGVKQVSSRQAEGERQWQASKRWWAMAGRQVGKERGEMAGRQAGGTQCSNPKCL